MKPTLTGRLTLADSIPQVSRLCYGLGSFGTGEIVGSRMHRLFDAFLEAGGNFFDTAHCYAFWVPDGLGKSERALGELIKRVGRENVVVATKGGHPQWPGYPKPDRYLSPEVIKSDLNESLDRLGTDFVDLYWLHRDDLREGVDAVISTLNQHIKSRQIKSLGASNWSPSRIAAANDYARRTGQAGFVASQPLFNLAQPNPLSDTTARFLTDEDQAWHRQSQLPVIAYTSTAGGYFDKQDGGGAFDNAISQARRVRAKELSLSKTCSPTGIALAYLMHQGFPVVPILGTTNLNHLAAAIESTQVSLTKEEVAYLHG